MNPLIRELVIALGTVKSHLDSVLERHPHLNNELFGVLACVEEVLNKTKEEQKP